MENGYEQLDEIDNKIIKLLLENSRMSFADIAREIDELTENAIRYRIEKLSDQGYISNYTIRLDPKKFGKNLISIIDINVLPENIDPTLDQLKKFKFITDIYLTSGRYPITLIGHFEDNAAVMSFVTKELKEIELIDYTLSTVLSNVKHDVFTI
jgi:DNA-binding Lrp family transcriptional regulator